MSTLTAGRHALASRRCAVRFVARSLGLPVRARGRIDRRPYPVGRWVDVELDVPMLSG